MPPVPGPSDRALDTRLLRFRSRPGSEPALTLASDLLDAGRATDALDIAGAGLAERPGDTDLRIIEGRSHMALGDLLKAQASLLEAAKAGQRKEPFRWLGEVLIRRGDGARAVKVLERARAIDPNDRAVVLLMQQADRLARGEPSQPVATQRPRPPTTRRTTVTRRSAPSSAPTSRSASRTRRAALPRKTTRG
jgi:tetratricopeptide (TPR) repeat protein